MTSAQRPIVSRPAPDDATGRENLLLLLQLRWIAVLGQVMTIAVVSLAFRVSLPLQAMAAILLILVGMNLVGHARLRAVKPVAKAELFGALLTDMAALSAQLFLSGGAANPFIFLYLLQITLGAVLLDAWSVWAFAALASAAFAALTRYNRPPRPACRPRRPAFPAAYRGHVGVFHPRRRLTAHLRRPDHAQPSGPRRPPRRPQAARGRGRSHRSDGTSRLRGGARTGHASGDALGDLE